MALDKQTMEQIYEAIDALWAGRSSFEIDGTSEIALEGRDEVNGMWAWPRETIMTAFSKSLSRPSRARAVMLELRKMEILDGPVKTSRRVNGKKVNVEYWVVAERGWLSWMKENMA